MIRLKIFWFLALAAVFFSACQQDDELTPITNNQQSEWINALGSSGSSENDIGCYEIGFPISFVMPDGSVVTANDQDEMETILNDNPAPIEIVFPMTLVGEDGNEIEVNNPAELLMYLDQCDDDDDDDDDEWDEFTDFEEILDCYNVEFPIEVQLSDSTTVSVMDMDELENLFDADPYPVDLIFPIVLVTEDGDLIEVEGYDQLEDLLDDCYGDDDDDDDDWEGEFECYEIGFPIDIELADGSVVTANDEDELEQILLGDPEPVDFVFPITLIGEDGEEIEVGDYDELEDLLEDCEEDDDEWFDEWDELWDNDCFELEFPIEVILSDDSTEEVGDSDELMDLFDYEPYPVNLVFPITLIGEDGEEYEVEEADELYDLLDSECDDDDEECGHELMSDFFHTLEALEPGEACYELVYPFTFFLGDGEEVTVEDADELADFADDPAACEEVACAEFPFEVINLETGDVIEVEDPEGIDDLVDECDD